MSSPTATYLEKQINEYGDTNGLRDRGNQISRRDYNNPIGGPPSEADGSSRSSPKAKVHHRREIWRRLKHKHNHAAPKVTWTKFMHSETKNRMFLPGGPNLEVAFPGWQDNRYGSSTRRVHWDNNVPVLRLCRNTSGEHRSRANGEQQHDGSWHWIQVRSAGKYLNKLRFCNS